MKDEEKKNIKQIIGERIPQLQCPFCHQQSFSIIDEYVGIQLSDDYRKVKLGGNIVPCFLLACNNCGFVSYHALGALGLLRKDDEDNKDNNDGTSV